MVNTEDIISSDKYIDKLSNILALKLMLESHASTISILKKELVSLEKIIPKILNKLKKTKKSRLVYVGAGTSGRIAVQDAVELYPTFGWPLSRIAFIIAGGMKALTKSVEGSEDNCISSKVIITRNKICKNDIVIGVSASGNTPFTADCILQAKKRGALTIAIVNNKESILQKNADLSICLPTGAEVVAGSTRLKAGTAQKICLNMISTLLMTRLGFVKNSLMVNLVPSNKKLIKRKKLIKKLVL